MTLYEKVGAAVVSLRQQKGLSQEKLSLETGIGRHYLSDIENGKRNLSLEIFDRLARYFGLNISEFLAMAEKQK